MFWSLPFYLSYMFLTGHKEKSLKYPTVLSSIRGSLQKNAYCSSLSKKFSVTQLTEKSLFSVDLLSISYYLYRSQKSLEVVEWRFNCLRACFSLIFLDQETMFVKFWKGSADKEKWIIDYEHRFIIVIFAVALNE